MGEWFKRTGKRDEVSNTADASAMRMSCSSLTSWGLERGLKLPEQIFLATKFALGFDEKGALQVRSDPEYVKTACSKSLERLGTDCIDLYYCHVSSQAFLYTEPTIVRDARSSTPCLLL